MTDWYAYPWELRGVTAQFRVDAAFSADPSLFGQRTTLIIFTCRTHRKAGKDFSFLERWHLEAVLKKAIEILGKNSVHVGCIDLPGQRVHYFYTNDARLLVPLYEYCNREARLALSCTKAEEPNRQTYYRFLLPDAAKVMSADNLDFIASYEKRGDIVATPRRIRFHFCFSQLQENDPFLLAAVEAGFTVGPIEKNAAAELPCSVTLHATAPLQHRPLTQLTTAAIRLADRYDGLFDRMEAEFVGKRTR